MCFVTAFRELTAIHINLKGIASVLVFQTLPMSLTAMHILMGTILSKVSSQTWLMLENHKFMNYNSIYAF